MLLREGRVDEALSAALALTEQYPDSDASWALAGIARARLGDLDGAQDDLERALALHPGDPAAAGNLAAIALRQGRIDVARGYYMQVLFHQPGHEQTLHKLSRLEQKAGNDAAAEALLERAIDAHPRRLSAYLKLVSFYRERGRGEEAMLRLQRVQQHFDAEPQYWSVLALLQLSAGDARAAVGSLSRRVALAPDALGYLQLANARAAAADAAGFEAALLQALELRPNDPAAGHLVSYYLEQAADDAARAERIARVRSVAPDRPELVRAAPPSAMPVAPARPSAR